jgi:hypothetical protein
MATDVVGEVAGKIKAYLEQLRDFGNFTLADGRPVLATVLAAPPDDGILESGPFPLACVTWQDFTTSLHQTSGVAQSDILDIRGTILYFTCDPRKSQRMADARAEIFAMYDALKQQRAYTGLGDPNIVISNVTPTRASVRISEQNQRDLICDGLIDFTAQVVHNYSLTTP